MLKLTLIGGPTAVLEYGGVRWLTDHAFSSPGEYAGGLVKTTNNGISYEHQFDREATVSIGAVAVAPSNKDIVWVGTGEANDRNSSDWGDGVYRSTDGGEKWQNVGLKNSRTIPRSQPWRYSIPWQPQLRPGIPAPFASSVRLAIRSVFSRHIHSSIASTTPNNLER